jgi:hypothetical protein
MRSKDKSRHSTVALKTRRARLLCRAAEPPSNQLIRICGFKSARGAMSGRPALIRQREAKQIIAAAKKAGAKQVEVKLPNEVAVIVHLDLPDDKDVAEEKPAASVAEGNEWLADDAH